MNAVAELPASVDAHPVLQRARQAARAEGLPYAGVVPPQDAWALVQAGLALLVDVRSAEERKFVGQVPGSLHVAWATGTALTRNPRFVRELEARLGGKDSVALLLCRSGKRSAAAAEAAAAAGFTNVFNVGEGFEGDLDAAQQRGHVNGWRRRALPWTQD
ncbi:MULTISPECIES: rhodanese-like domain-containing protein [unclassified Rubrivivax]|uniref:rhodanese-like domain-containing protein n=1 Tax=unclassified Rubrivivax TaxID=2649762 RepID=UPI001E32F71B|nr:MULTISPECIES: rhodanese-like domain-containing protein [unclassified Rubrivivax]MCC9597122.1 rhodanese-like domain-containing protein [Rubrivivax sp. JA1055]MCC9646619.1 rhodanese-like domain-containing protein [Rubrivivax sp. JA1029]